MVNKKSDSKSKLQFRVFTGNRVDLERKVLYAVALGKPDADDLVRKLNRKGKLRISFSSSADTLKKVAHKILFT